MSTSTAPTTVQIPAGTWTIDPSHSEVGFSVRHLMVSKVKGNFETFSGTIVIGEDPLASSVTAEVDLNSINTRDAQRDGHLRSADFFDAENHPKITFTVNNISRTDDDDYKVTGNLTILGITKPVVWEVEDEGQATDPWGNDRWGFHAKTKINRKDFGLNWNVALEKGGWLVGDEVKIDIDLETIYTPATQPETAALA